MEKKFYVQPEMNYQLFTADADIRTSDEIEFPPIPI